MSHDGTWRLARASIDVTAVLKRKTPTSAQRPASAQASAKVWGMVAPGPLIQAIGVRQRTQPSPSRQAGPVTVSVLGSGR